MCLSMSSCDDRCLCVRLTGNFGCVYRGLLQHGEQKEEKQVAVKTLKTLTGRWRSSCFTPSSRPRP